MSRSSIFRVSIAKEVSFPDKINRMNKIHLVNLVNPVCCYAVLCAIRSRLAVATSIARKSAKPISSSIARVSLSV